MNAHQLFETSGLKRHDLGTLTESSHSGFFAQYIALFQSREAASIAQVVYVFSTAREIPRIKGSSDILYIGQTSQTIERRYGDAKSIKFHEDHFTFYKHTIETYGPIRFSYAVTDKFKDLEISMLTHYEKEHLEIPPRNRQGKYPSP